jgi:hypothetical protein
VERSLFVEMMTAYRQCRTQKNPQVFGTRTKLAFSTVNHSSRQEGEGMRSLWRFQRRVSELRGEEPQGLRGQAQKVVAETVAKFKSSVEYHLLL